MVTTAYEISEDTKTGKGILRIVNRTEGGVSGSIGIESDEAMKELIEAYDEGRMDEWIYMHAEEMYFNGCIK